MSHKSDYEVPSELMTIYNNQMDNILKQLDMAIAEGSNLDLRNKKSFIEWATAYTKNYEITDPNIRNENANAKIKPFVLDVTITPDNYMDYFKSEDDPTNKSTW
jgi:hypothetical protein